MKATPSNFSYTGDVVWHYLQRYREIIRNIGKIGMFAIDKILSINKKFSIGMGEVNMLL